MPVDFSLLITAIPAMQCLAATALHDAYMHQNPNRKQPEMRNLTTVIFDLQAAATCLTRVADDAVDTSNVNDDNNSNELAWLAGQIRMLVAEARKAIDD